MSDFLSLDAYPPDYHLGFSMFLWFIYISVSLFIGIIYIFKAHKAQLINRKELYYGSGFFAFGSAGCFIFIQVGIFIPSQFPFWISIGFVSMVIGLLFLTYFWERNIGSLKKIPTLINLFTLIFTILNVIYIIITRDLVFDFFITTSILLAFSNVVFLIILISIFTKNVRGDLRKYGLISISSILIYEIGIFLDHPPGVTLFPEITLILVPLLFIIGFIFFFIYQEKIIDAISSYYQQENICTVHRGKIERGDTIYHCPSCNTTYCKNCFEQVVKKDNCWNCNHQFEEITESIMKVDSEDKKSIIIEDSEHIYKKNSKETIKDKKLNHKKSRNG